MTDYVTDAQYKAMLLALLEIQDPSDALHSWSIPRLEELVLSVGLELPIVNRLTPNPVPVPPNPGDPIELPTTPPNPLAADE